MFEFDGKSSVQRTFERATELGEPEAVFLGPGRLPCSEDKAVITQHARETVLGGGTVGVIRVPQSQESSEGLVILTRDVYRCEVSATVKTGEHDGIETVGLAPVSRSSRNE